MTPEYGVIRHFAGIPKDPAWKHCDGTAGTRDLRDVYPNAYAYLPEKEMSLPECPKHPLELAAKHILAYAEGTDSSREGLQETPARVAKAWKHWLKGYGEDPAAILKVFEDGAEGSDELVLVRRIPVYSHCEHHLAPIFGTVTIGYIPNGRIVGLSKLSRLVDCFGRRLQVQERLTTQIADALDEHLAPKGVGVIMTARHMCMESRGICQQGHDTRTSALRGVIKTDSALRAEFMKLSEG